MTESADAPAYLYAECPDCQWDCIIGPPMPTGLAHVVGCPLCMEDNRRFVRLSVRSAVPEDSPEGFDARNLR